MSGEMGNSGIILGRLHCDSTRSLFVKAGAWFYATRIPVVLSDPRATSGDLVAVFGDSHGKVLWRPRSTENILLPTLACNQRCLSCPQPREADDGSSAILAEQVVSLLHKNEIRNVTITGGEPSLSSTHLSRLLSLLVGKNDNATISVLTNGMNFDDPAYAHDVVESARKQTKFCVALYADAFPIHDRLTGVPGSFERTIAGILNLHKERACIEIRIIMNRQNAGRFSQMARFIASNFPFVAHVAFMGLEVHAEAAINADMLWIDPKEYASELERALQHLLARRMVVSVYNLPFCLIVPAIRAYTRDSISEWKKTFLPACDDCRLKQQCPGLFGTSAFQSPSIMPIR